MKNYIKDFIQKNREKAELKIALDSLIEESTLTFRFIIFTFISSALAALGILMNNIAILIGAMIVAPMLIPILSLSVGIGAGSIKLIKHSLKSMIIGFALSLATAATIAYLFTPATLSNSIYEGYANQDLYAIVAALSGILAVYSWFSTTKNTIIPAVGVAVSLVPPLAFVGILIPGGDYTKLIDVLELLLINLVGITLGAFFTFLLVRLFNKQPNNQVDKEVEEEVENHEKNNTKKN